MLDQAEVLELGIDVLIEDTWTPPSVGQRTSTVQRQSAGPHSAFRVAGPIEARIDLTCCTRQQKGNSGEGHVYFSFSVKAAFFFLSLVRPPRGLRDSSDGGRASWMAPDRQERVGTEVGNIRICMLYRGG